MDEGHTDIHHRSLIPNFMAFSLGNSLSVYSSRPCRWNAATTPYKAEGLSNLLRPNSNFRRVHTKQRPVSRKLISIQGTLTQKSDENELESNIIGNQSGVLERWTIKFEQSFNIFLIETVIKILDALYSEKHYARFYVLETIARVPYFAFLSVLHMYESFGWWRRTDYLKVHFAESWNELHHLLIMEALGGNERWFDRFLAQHIAVFYYFMTAFMYILSPRMAYHFSECVEKHAFSTYDKFIKLQGEELKKLPAPDVAVKYYTQGDLYLFDEFQTDRIPCSRRPKVENLYDVFVNIRDDEAEHCKTMKACQTHGNLMSPHHDTKSTEDDTDCSLPPAECAGIVDCVKKSLSYLPPSEKSSHKL